MCAAKIPFATTTSDAGQPTNVREHRLMRTGEGTGRRAPVCVRSPFEPSWRWGRRRRRRPTTSDGAYHRNRNGSIDIARFFRFRVYRCRFESEFPEVPKDRSRFVLILHTDGKCPRLAIRRRRSEKNPRNYVCRPCFSCLVVYISMFEAIPKQSKPATNVVGGTVDWQQQCHTADDRARLFFSVVRSSQVPAPIDRKPVPPPQRVVYSSHRGRPAKCQHFFNDLSRKILNTNLTLEIVPCVVCVSDWTPNEIPCRVDNGTFRQRVWESIKKKNRTHFTDSVKIRRVVGG